MTTMFGLAAVASAARTPAADTNTRKAIACNVRLISEKGDAALFRILFARRSFA
jgi:hypothetical protein